MKVIRFLPYTFPFVITAFLNACSSNTLQREQEPPSIQPSRIASIELTPEEIEKKWKESSEPGTSHQELAALVGDWKTESKWWVSPNREPETSKGTAQNKWILGKRFLEQNYQSSVRGQQFQGKGMIGYDNVTHSYISTWADSMTTQIMWSVGRFDPQARSWTFIGTYVDPVTKESKETRAVTRIENAKKHFFEMYDRGPNGQEWKTLEIAYTRVK